MQKYSLNELREKFLRFFESKDHLRLPSFSLIPENDPSILLVNAGMTPLKPYFTGELKPPSNRITTCQKCIRTPDIERVGKTARHGTYFEMLGNFSFGDYFKKEAIGWSWEFVTKELKIPEKRLWISIYTDDDEAFEIWNKEIGIPKEKIVRLGKEDNFWEHGTGPCGPCSEIYYDRGKDKGCVKNDCRVGCECDRYVEIWNLVFTQFYKEPDGTYTPLKKKNIDTGLGLERLACIMQGVDNLFEVDTIKNILLLACRISGKKYGEKYSDDISIRVITDHIRSTTMMISDGIIPSNEGAGYVLRRLLRRAARQGKLLGLNKPFLTELVDAVVLESKDAYPELEQRLDYIKKVVRIEEERFNLTIDQGLTILNNYIQDMLPTEMIPGKILFKLHDTYGFPIDLTREIAEENNLTVDEAGFEKEMEVQKAKARDAMKKKEDSAWAQSNYPELSSDIRSEFLGYGCYENEVEILQIIKEGNGIERAVVGDKVMLLLDKTPFYAESGGQIGDTGFIISETGMIRIKDCKKSPEGIHVHIGTVKEGFVLKGQHGKAKVDLYRRKEIMRNHTATHLIHKALRNVLGNHVSQAGSFVGDKGLRFDFTHFEPISKEELKNIEYDINSKILEDIPVTVEIMELEKAKSVGAEALFGEKYGDLVRVIKIGDYSLELCGGTHVDSTAQIGPVKILSETGIAAGIRRIEAISGHHTLAHFWKKEELVDDIATALKTTPEEVTNKIKTLIGEVKNAHKEIGQLKNKIISDNIDEILSKAIMINGTTVISTRLSGADTGTLRNTGDTLKSRLPDSVIIIASDYDSKVNMVAMATKEAVKKGIHTGKIIKEISKIVAGGGGGRPEMAQAGGKDLSKIDQALEYSIRVIKNQLKEYKS